jgi:hypothetical protein
VLTLDPKAILLMFIPPLLFWTALSTSLHDLRRNLKIRWSKNAGQMTALARPAKYSVLRLPNRRPVNARRKPSPHLQC